MEDLILTDGAESLVALSLLLRLADDVHFPAFTLYWHKSALLMAMQPLGVIWSALSTRPCDASFSPQLSATPRARHPTSTSCQKPTRPAVCALVGRGAS